MRDEPRQGLGADFSEEPLHPGRIITARGDGDDLEILAAIFVLQRRELRHLDPAGRAPRGPKVHQHRLALVIGERDLTAILALERHVRAALRLGMHRELAHVALAQGLDVGGGGVCKARCRHVKTDENDAAHVTSFKDDRMTESSNAMWGGRFAAGPDAITLVVEGAKTHWERIGPQLYERRTKEARAVVRLTGDFSLVEVSFDDAAEWVGPDEEFE